MALHRGIQSAIFYYLSCAPCAEARSRKKRKNERVRGRLERQLLEAENPNLYRQPSPSTTNPHWEAEIALGPTFSGRGRRKPNSTENQRARKSGAIAEHPGAEASSVDLPRRPTSDEPNDSKWNLRLYQREDEELWGSMSNIDAASSYAGSLTKPQRVLTKGSTSSSDQTFRHPAINDMHPATVTKIHSPEEVMWMMQPPPVAEVMQGKERVSRSRSDSGGSRLMSPSSVSLSRQLSSRLVQNKLKSIETANSMSRESSSRAGNGPYGQRHDRSATTSQRDFAVSPASLDGNEIQMPSPVQLPQDVVSSGAVGTADFLSPDSGIRTQPRRITSRPLLTTIASDSDTSSVRQRLPSRPTSASAKENKLPTPPHSRDGASPEQEALARQFPILVRDASVKLAGDVTTRSLSGHLIRTIPTADIPDDLYQISSHKHAPSEDTLLHIQPELLEDWHTPDFELGKWVHETTKREVKQRWSMDL